MTRRTAIWKSIRDTLAGDIAAGRYRPGDKLPTEAELSARFGVNRHTVRHALSVLADEGLTVSRRGAGVYVMTVPTDYPLGRRVRFHQNLRAAGRMPDKMLLAFETRPADQREGELLKLAQGAMVHVYEGLSFADGLPVALARSVFPEARLPGFAKHMADDLSITEALGRSGVSDYTRASTRLTACLATATQAIHLKLREGAALLRSDSVNVDSDGRPIEMGRTWFVGDRITLTLEDDG